MAAGVVLMSVEMARRFGRGRRRQTALFAQLVTCGRFVIVLGAASVEMRDPAPRGRFVHVAQQWNVRILQAQRDLARPARGRIP